MTASALSIAARHRQGLGELASLADFSSDRQEPFEPARLLDDPTLSLYCLDPATERAIFVELPPDVDLAAAPFVYLSQYEQAQRLIAVPYETFLELAERLPDPTGLVTVFMTGRSGSTLLSRMLGEVDGVLSLSEPDVITQFVHLRRSAGDDASLRRMVRSCVRFLARPSRGEPGTTLALKFRGEGVRVMDLMAEIFPAVRTLFSYRDAVGWVTSFCRLANRVGWPEREPWDESLAWPRSAFGPDLLDPVTYLGRAGGDVALTEMFALFWLSVVDQYLQRYTRAGPVLALRYRDLDAHREEVASALLAHCGLPATALPSALRAFERDSQEGTPLERSRAGEAPFRLRPEQIAEVEAVVGRHPLVATQDFTVPATLRVSEAAG